MKYNDNPLVIIGVPTRNRALLLIDTINSLTKQTHTNIEIIISDNASTDDTEKVVKGYIKKFSKIRYIKHKKKISAVDNFNSILNKAKGDYFMWAADDDLWDKYFIEEIIKMFKRDDDAVLISTQFSAIDTKGVEKKNKRCSFSSYPKDEIDFKTYLKEDFFHFKANIFYGIYRTEILKKIGGYNKLPVLSASDCLTIHRIMSEGKVLLVRKKLFYKRERFFNDTEEAIKYRYSQSLLKISKTVLEIILSTLSNILPQNFLYIFKQVKTYFKYNQRLILSNHTNDTFYLTIINFMSSFNLFLALFPNNINGLKMRNKEFSGKI